MTEALPDLDTRYDPRRDSGALARLVNNAHAWRQRLEFAAEEVAAAGEAVARHLESLWTAEEVALMRKYGCAAEADGFNVSVGDDGPLLGVMLGRKIAVPHFLEGRSLAWDPDPAFPEPRVVDGAEAWEAAGPEGRAQARTRLQRYRPGVPPSVRPLLERVAAARRAHEADKRAAAEFGAGRRASGRHPTWREIGAAVPALGEYLARREAAPAGPERGDVSPSPSP
jgi:hypothetical protein